MRRLVLGSILCCLAFAPVWATQLTPPTLSPGARCRAAITAAERGQDIPTRLLASIGRVESGRLDPATGTFGAWPWTINVAGQGTYFDSKAEAIARVSALRAQGVRSIDVGCMQVNLAHHPDAFATLDAAFEPEINANYAARFLRQLFGQTSDWMKATAAYHSSTPAEGTPYAAKVAEVWPDEQRRAEADQIGVPPLASMANSLFSSPASQSLSRTAPAAPGRQPAAPGAAGAIAGHGLDFYRAVPVRVVMNTLGPPGPVPGLAPIAAPGAPPRLAPRRGPLVPGLPLPASRDTRN